MRELLLQLLTRAAHDEQARRSELLREHTREV
jgi:hypothetical protein